MDKNISISLSDHHQDFIQKLVESGRYGSASEVIQDALRLAEERDAQIKALDQAIQEGLDSGPAQDFDWGELIERKFAGQKTGNAA